jgi:Acetyltransferase (GNAT) domain
MPVSEPRSASPKPRVPPAVVEVDPIGDGRWDAFVESRTDGLVYHHSSWLRTLAAEYGQKPLGLAAIASDGRWTGVLALMATRGLPLARGAIAGRRLSSLPRTPVSGPLATDDAAREALLRSAVDRARGSGRQLQVKTLEPALDDLVAGLVGHPWRLNYVLELPDDPGALRFGHARNHSRIRWSVNKARKAGVTVRTAVRLEDVLAWHPLYLDTMRRHVVPPRPLRLFVAMWEHMRPAGTMRLLLAERDGRPLAGSVLLALNETVFYAFNGVDRAALADRPNDIIQWEAIRSAAAEGFRRYDLGEVVERHEGLADFKRKWGTEPRRMHRYYFPAPTEAPDPGDGEHGRSHRIAHTTWRRLPLRVVAAAGDFAYRYL